MASTNDDKEEPSGLLPTKRAKTVETYENKPLEESRFCRSKTSKINWSLCIFCHKGVKTLTHVSSFDACQTIISAAEARGDTGLLTNIRGLDWVMRASKIHILYKCSVMIGVTRKRETLRHYSLCKYK